MADPFDPNNPNRTPYTGQFGAQPQQGQLGTQTATNPMTGPTQLAGYNRPKPPMNYSTVPQPTAIGMGIAQQGSTPITYGQTGTQYSTTPGGTQIVNTGKNLFAINPDTGQPYTDQIGAPRTFTGTNGLTQFGNQNLSLLGGDPNNTGSGYGGTNTYANQQNARLQALGLNQLGAAGPQMNTGATNMFATGVGNALGQIGATNQAGMDTLGGATRSDLHAMEQGNNLAGTANGMGVMGQFNAANQLMGMSQMPAGPSVAEQQLQQGGEAAMRQQMAMAAGARGGNSALALQNAGLNQGAAMAQLNGQMGIQRAQEDMANRQFAANAVQSAGNLYGAGGAGQQNAYAGAANVYGNAANNQVAQAGQINQIAQNQLGQANTNLGLTNTYANLAGQQLGADVTSRGQNIQGAQGFMGMGYGLQTNDRNAVLAQQQALADLNARLYGINRGADQAAQQANDDKFFRTLGAGTQAAASVVGMGAMSDIRAKKNIKPAGDEVSDAFRAANNSANAIRGTQVDYPMGVGAAPAYSYGYKNPYAPGAKPGVQYGPMAQDLEKTPAGASVVSTGPNGMKSIDTDRLSLMSAAEIAKQRAELDALKESKALTVDRRAPMVTQLPKLNPANFGQYGAPSEVNPYVAAHPEVIGTDMNGNPVLARPQQKGIGFQPWQMGYMGQ